MAYICVCAAVSESEFYAAVKNVCDAAPEVLKPADIVKEAMAAINKTRVEKGEDPVRRSECRPCVAYLEKETTRVMAERPQLRDCVPA